MLRFRRSVFAVGLAVSFCSAAHALDINEDPTPQEHFYASGMGMPVQNREKVFEAKTKRANFTSFEGVENVGMKDGKLLFTLAGPKATLGWGNYLGQQPLAEIEDMWHEAMVVQLRVRQSAAQSKWTVCLWRDGGRVPAWWGGKAPSEQAELKGQDWQELGFKRLEKYCASPDGLEFTIEGEKGTRIEIEWLKLVQPFYEGWFRHEFTVPEGKVWRAVADVGQANDTYWWNEGYQCSSRLHLNGRVVERQSALGEFHTAPVDIAPYLKPGRNCVGFYGFGIFRPSVLYFQARIIMGSGEVVPVTSGPDWKYSATAAEGWSQPGFDDATWVQATPKGSAISALSPAGDYAHRPNIPTYSGRLVLKNPTRRDLFYPESSDVVVDVHVPAGLKSRQPSLGFLLGRADLEGTCTLAKEGQESSFAEQRGSLVYRLNLGRHEHGVYVLALSLKAADGTTIEERRREPLVVLRRVPQKQIAGKDYLEGLDLELEDTVDFTNPEDPHPWIESRLHADQQQWATGAVPEGVKEPVIVRRGGLAYREVAGAIICSGFSYRIEFRHPGSFYCLELEYPDDAKRTIAVTINSKIERIINCQSGVGAETGGRFLPTGKMETLRWIHVADPGPHSVDVYNVFSGEKAAAKCLRIFRVKGDLPSVASGASRLYGIQSERCFYTSGIGLDFGVGRGKRHQDGDWLWRELPKVPPMRTVLQDLTWMVETGERYIQYLRFAGQNCHVMGCIQYNDANSPFVPAPQFEDSRVLHCMKTMMANLFERNDIDFYAGIQPSNFDAVRSFANNAQVAKGADTVFMVNAQGRQRYTIRPMADFLAVPNWLHPLGRAAYSQLMHDLAATYGHLSRFRGVHGWLGLRDTSPPAFTGFSWPPDPWTFSFDDVTAGLFEQDTGIRLPVSGTDPQRFAKRAAFLRHASIRERFLTWRCEKLKDFCAGAVRTLHAKRPDLQLVNVLMSFNDFRVIPFDAQDAFSYLMASGKPFKALMRDQGLDVGLLNTVPDLWTGRFAVSWLDNRTRAGQPPQQDPYWWLARTSPDVVSLFEHDGKRYVYVVENFLEQPFSAGGHVLTDAERYGAGRLVESDWIMTGYKEEAVIQPAGYHCREAFTHAMVTADPRLLICAFTDMGINLGHEQMLRSILKTYTCLLPERFKPVVDTGLETNLAIRQLTKGNESFFYVANPCQWHVSGTIALETDGQVTELVTGNPVALTGQGKTRQLAVKLTPFDLVAYRVSSPRLGITGYRTDPMGAEELARLQGVVNRIALLVNDPVAKLSLAPADRKPVEIGVRKAREAIEAGEYARAWSLLTQPQVWAMWQDYLEKAATQDKAPGARGRIDHDRANNCIAIVGFPEDAPATMDTILGADAKNRWGKVRYDRRTDTYTVDASLWIGDDQANGTFLQIGDKQHPKVTVVVKGSVWVRPHRETLPRSDGRESIVNNLTLGDSDDKTVRATLKIDCQKPGEHGVFVGHQSDGGKATTNRGELHVYNSTITAATPDRQHVWSWAHRGPPSPYGWTGWQGSDIRLVNATISWSGGGGAYGLASGKPRAGGDAEVVGPHPRFIIEGTTFEHCGGAVTSGDQYLKDCVFRDLDVAVQEGGCLGARLVNCTFEGNRANWTLGAVCSRGIVLLDCKLGSQDEPIRIQKNTGALQDYLMPRRLPQYPACSERVSLLVKVTDAAGKPVPQAGVVVSCKDAPGEVTRGATLTDEKGLTPADPESDAIVITTRKYQATDNPDQPKVSTFSYEVVVTKQGFRTATVVLPEGQPTPRPLVVRLEK